MSKRILIVSDIHTHPCLGGNQQCIMQYAENLRGLGFEIFFLLVKTYGMDVKSIPPTREYWGEHYLEYETPWLEVQYQRIVRKLYKDAYPDILDFIYPWGLNRYINKKHLELNFAGVVVNYIWMSRVAFCSIPTKALFTHDIFTDRRKNIPHQYWYSFSKKNEAKALMRFENVLAIQDEERDFFKTLSPTSKVVSVYSSFKYIEQPFALNKNILFFSGGGGLNVNGIKRFIRDVFPLIIEKDNEIKLLIGGGICKTLGKETLHSNIVLKGQYDNPDDFYELGDICINPVYEGSGLKIKTFEALAHGKLTIVDPHSATGVYQPESIPLYRAKCPQEYIDIILHYMGNADALAKKQQECEEYINGLNNYILQQYAEVFK